MVTFAAIPEIPVPPVSWLDLKWQPHAPERYSRREVMRQTGGYRAAVPAQIAALLLQLPQHDAADIEDATRALVEFDTYARVRLASDSPALGPMAAILLRTEAASSSQIEQLTTSAKQLALAEIAVGGKTNAKAVVGNVRAMEAAIKLSERIDVETILGMHHALLHQQVAIDPEFVGQFRKQQVWIGPGDAGPRTADFVPPPHNLIDSAMADLLEFMQREDLPLLVQCAIAHAQFETIHPFVDGNGRVGRALTQMFLRHKGVVASTTIPISAGLLTNTAAYFAALDSYRAGDAAPIIRRFAQASRLAAATGKDLVDQLAQELHHAKQRVTGVRSDSAVWRVLPELIKQPVVNATYLRSQLGLTEVAALRALKTLTARGVLTETTGKSRDRVWQQQEILGTLDKYAAKIRRLTVGG